MMLSFKIWDVQHGNAMYIKTPNGKHIVVDLGVGSYGEDDERFSPLLRLRDRWGVHRLDGVIITHPHTDHIGDILNFDLFEPRVLYSPEHLTDEAIRSGNQDRDENVIAKYLEVSHRYSAHAAPGQGPTYPANNGGALFEIFWPCTCSQDNLNDHSVTTVVSYADSKMLIPGDNENCCWMELLKDPKFLDAISGTDILLASHHGRESGYCGELFSYINPYLTIISDGPFCDTSATSRYCEQTKGLMVVHRSNSTGEERYCVTTRCDGVIEVLFGRNSAGNRTIGVTID
jgi:beta-lactamase superfamily II metal-dependent hydrolase